MIFFLPAFPWPIALRLLALVLAILAGAVAIGDLTFGLLLGWSAVAALLYAELL